MDKLKTKIESIKKDIKNLTSKFCDEKFSVAYYGAFDIDPKYLVYWICVQTDKVKHDLENNEFLRNDLRELLDKNDYPIDSRKHVAIGFESQETVDRESNGNWWHHFK